MHLEAEVIGQDAAIGEPLVALANHALRSRAQAVMSAARSGFLGQARFKEHANGSTTNRRVLVRCLCSCAFRVL